MCFVDDDLRFASVNPSVVTTDFVRLPVVKVNVALLIDPDVACTVCPFLVNEIVKVNHLK